MSSSSSTGRRRPRALRRLLDLAAVADLEEDDGDVVLAAAGVRRVDQRACGDLEVVAAVEHREELVAEIMSVNPSEQSR